MTATIPAATVEWGVRHRTSVDRVTHVDVKPCEADARRFHHALLYNGNADAEVVTRAAGSEWQLAPASTGAEASRG